MSEKQEERDRVYNSEAHTVAARGIGEQSTTNGSYLGGRSKTPKMIPNRVLDIGNVLYVSEKKILILTDINYDHKTYVNIKIIDIN